MSDDANTAPVNSSRRACGRLWQRAPSVDLHGVATSDFLLWIPHLEQRGPIYHEQLRQAVLQVCETYQEQVLLVDLNLKRGTVWFSLPGIPGLPGKVAGDVQNLLPEAKLVGTPLQTCSSDLTLTRTGQLISRIRQRVWRRLLPSPPDSDAR